MNYVVVGLLARAWVLRNLLQTAQLTYMPFLSVYSDRSKIFMNIAVPQEVWLTR